MYKFRQSQIYKSTLFAVTAAELQVLPGIAINVDLLYIYIFHRSVRQSNKIE